MDIGDKCLGDKNHQSDDIRPIFSVCTCEMSSNQYIELNFIGGNHPQSSLPLIQ